MYSIIDRQVGKTQNVRVLVFILFYFLFMFMAHNR